MQHLNPEAIARLVDEPPMPDEAGHLRDCLVCRRELAEMRAQTAALASLPDLEPGDGAWRALEASLAGEALVRPRAVRRFRPAHPYLRAAAAIILLVTGMAAGTSLLRPGGGTRVAAVPEAPTGTSARPLGLAGLPAAPVAAESARGGAVPASDAPELPAVIADVPLAPEAPRTVRHAPSLPAARLVAARPTTPRGRAPALTPEARAAARELDAAEAAYVAALRRYAEIADPSSGADPETRLSALETLVESTGRALERAPGDPVLNGYHLAVVDERDALRTQLDRAAKTAWY